jgi:DNA-binding NarL/FixJ family response regulator
MHISLVSLSKDNKSCFGVLQGLSDAPIEKVTTLEYLIDKNIFTDLVFFDAELGKQCILQEVHLYHQMNKKMKWMVTHLGDVYQAIQYLEAGASGILSGSCDEDELQKSIQFIHENQFYLDDDLIQILAFRQIKKILQPFNQLTAREFDVFCLLAEDYSIEELAEALSVTTKTAFNCQTQLRKKLKIKNKQQLIDLANNYRLIF